jgi:hypothetical protein
MSRCDNWTTPASTRRRRDAAAGVAVTAFEVAGVSVTGVTVTAVAVTGVTVTAVAVIGVIAS